jgi:hypothetical protein
MRQLQLQHHASMLRWAFAVASAVALLLPSSDAQLPRELHLIVATQVPPQRFKCMHLTFLQCKPFWSLSLWSVNTTINVLIIQVHVACIIKSCDETELAFAWCLILRTEDVSINCG